MQRKLFEAMSSEAASLRAQIASLQSRLQDLERSSSPKVLKASTKTFDMSAHPRRKVALLFTYEGWHYSGLAFQNQPTPLPTVEGEIMAALKKARLVDMAESFQDVGFSRCGRTDRGVSSSGQVVSLWVRSNLAEADLEGTQAVPPRTPIPSSSNTANGASSESGDDGDEGPLDPRAAVAAPLVQPSHPNLVKPEFNYATMLNRILAPSIRILAWSPADLIFDARFSCHGRHYKYFFTSSPAHPLDIQAMQEAVQLLLGEHDFRNMCKIDASKQIHNFRRRIIDASIAQLPSHDPDTQHFVLDLHGTAFLYHQVRHMVAVLFLVGARLEQPSVVSDLLDVDEGKCPTKPDYEMAHDAPLVLWKCDFPKETLNWQVDPTATERMYSLLELPTIYQHVRECHINALKDVSASSEQPAPTKDSEEKKTVYPAQLGAGTALRTSQQRYVPLMRRKRGEHFEVVNQRWRESDKGQRIIARFSKPAVAEATDEGVQAE